MPKALLDKMLAASTFDAGFRTVEFTSSALVDMAYHSRPDAPEDPGRLRGRDAEEARHARGNRHAPPHAAFRARVFGRRLFGRLLFLPVVGGARRRRLLGVRGDRRPVQSGARGEAEEADLRGRRLGRPGGALHRLPRQDADARRHDGQARAAQEAGSIGPRARLSQTVSEISSKPQSSCNIAGRWLFLYVPAIRRQP